jgi:hypothetical protein
LPQNDALAITWYRKAAYQKTPGDMFNAKLKSKMDERELKKALRKRKNVGVSPKMVDSMLQSVSGL